MRDLIDGSERWDMMIAFPPCTKLSGVGAGHYWKWQKDGTQEEAVSFFMDLVNAPIEKIVIENPQGIMSTRYRKPDQVINPWQFGEPWKKRTCLWLKGVQPLVPTNVVTPVGHWVDGGSMKRTWGNVPFGTYSEAECRTNSARAHARSRTFQGIADAMAEQWG